MTKEGKMYAAGGVGILALLLLLWLWAILLWIGLGLALLTVVIIGWRVWGVVQHRRIEGRLARAEAIKAEAEAEQARVLVEHTRAVAEQQRAIAAGLWAQKDMIPASMVGILLETPADRERLATWAQPKKVIYQGVVEASAAPAPALPPPSLPQAHVWEVIEPGVGPDRFYLGAALDELGQSAAVWVPLDGVITLVSIGPQGLGKTTLARSLALQQVMQGGEVAICDWFNDLAAEMSRFFPHCYSEPDDCEAYVVAVLTPEMEARHAAYKAGRRDFPALLWLIDEWAMLRKDCPAMAEALVHAFTLWRKLGLRTVVSSVALDTRDLGVSKSAVSTLALFSGNENLARTWGLSGIKPQLDRLYTSGRGYCLITSQHLQRQAELLALPNVTSAVFRSVLHRTRPDLMQRALDTYQGLPALPMKQSSSSSSSGGGVTPTDLRAFLEKKNQKKMPYTEAERQEVLRLHLQEGLPASRIARAMGKDTNFYYQVKAILQAAYESAGMELDQEAEDEG